VGTLARNVTERVAGVATLARVEVITLVKIAMVVAVLFVQMDTTVVMTVTVLVRKIAQLAVVW
jgi:hypothetical protein